MAAGASQPKRRDGNSTPSSPAGPAAEAAAAQARRLTFHDGRRGVQDSNRLSKAFSSFIVFSLQRVPELLQAVTVSPGDSIGGKLKQPSDLLKSVLMPNLKHDGLPLLPRQFGQGRHRALLLRALLGRTFKPAFRFPFPGQSPPQAAPIIKRPVPVCPDCVVFRGLRAG